MDCISLSEHTGVLISLIGVFAGLSGFLFWRILYRLEAKLDNLFELAFNCRQTLAERFVRRFEHDQQLTELWDALNHHDHDQEGRVVR